MTPAAPERPRRLTGWIAVPAVVGLVLDQLTKTWAVNELADREIDVFWTLRFNLSLNPGASFGLGRGVTPLFMGLGVVLLAVLLLYSRRVQSTTMAIALGLVIGGAAGNLFDRFLRDNGGAVIDFIDFQWWPVFNVADIFVVGGAILLVLTAKDPPVADPVPDGPGETA